MTYTHGIDVSNFNGAFNWGAFEGKIQFAAAKATEGTGFVDPYFAYNWKSMKNMGIHRWAYHFAHPGKDPVTQAKLASDVVTAQGFGKGDNFMLDLEVNDFIPASAVVKWAREFCGELQKLHPHNRVVLYSYPFFLEENGLTNADTQRYLWIANYGVAEPSTPGWSTWSFWQYYAPQIATSTSCDLNVFNGDAARLASFCNTVGTFN